MEIKRLFDSNQEVKSTVDIVEDEKEQFILAFPRGNFFIQHMNKTLKFDDKFFNRVMENFNDENLTKPFIDKNHELEDSFGDILGFELSDEGLKAKVKLNDHGVDTLKSREYRYISPTFGNLKDTNGKTVNDVLISISLTNIPALMGNLPQLQDQLSLENRIEQVYTLSYKIMEEKMEMTKLAKYLKLQDEASPDAIMEAVMSIQESLATAMATIESITAEKDEAVEGKAEADEKVEEMSKKLGDLEEKADEEEKELFFKTAVSDSKLSPEEAEKFKGIWKLQKEFVKDFVQSREAKSDDEKITLETKAGSMTKLEQEDIDIMTALGMDSKDEKQVEKYLKSQEL